MTLSTCEPNRDLSHENSNCDPRTSVPGHDFYPALSRLSFAADGLAFPVMLISVSATLTTVPYEGSTGASVVRVMGKGHLRNHSGGIYYKRCFPRPHHMHPTTKQTNKQTNMVILSYDTILRQTKQFDRNQNGTAIEDMRGELMNYFSWCLMLYPNRGRWRDPN